MTTTAATADRRYPCFKCLATGQLSVPSGVAPPDCPLCAGTGFIGDPLWKISPIDHLLHGFYLVEPLAEAACTQTAVAVELLDVPDGDVDRTPKCHVCLVYIGQALNSARSDDRDRYQP
jgi:hypothetical protein